MKLQDNEELVIEELDELDSSLFADESIVLAIKPVPSEIESLAGTTENAELQNYIPSKLKSFDVTIEGLELINDYDQEGSVVSTHTNIVDFADYRIVRVVTEEITDKESGTVYKQDKLEDIKFNLDEEEGKVLFHLEEDEPIIVIDKKQSPKPGAKGPDDAVPTRSDGQVTSIDTFAAQLVSGAENKSGQLV